MIEREQLIQELHAADVAACPEPPSLEERSACVRAYYERVVNVVEAHIKRPRQKLVWEGCCDRCGHRQMFASGGVKACKWGRCSGEIRPRIIEINAPVD